MTIDKPFTFEILQAEKITLSRYDHHIIRRLSNMKGQFLDLSAYQEMLAKDDLALYEVYDIQRPEIPVHFGRRCIPATCQQGLTSHDLYGL